MENNTIAQAWARTAMHDANPDMSSRGIWRGQWVNALLVVLTVALVFPFGYSGLVLVLNAASFTFFTYRLLISIAGLRDDRDFSKMAELNDELPTYCVLLPMRNEKPEVVAKLIANISNLNYPTDKLDVVMLVDEDDDFLEAVTALPKPDHFRILSASAKFPFTKPKVCNYGLYTTDAEFVTIYDVEDNPEPNQLLRVLYKFDQDQTVACVQCQLKYVNDKPTILARFFELEYLAWFSTTIHGLSRVQGADGFIPLGGTSQHLRTDILTEMGGWDAVNVTEDCELGVRLCRKGYRVATSDSVTEEIAVEDIKTWIPQRTRWQMGFMVTFLAHTRSYTSLIRDLGWWRFFNFKMSVFGNFMSPLITPLLFVIFIRSLFFSGEGETYLRWVPVVTIFGNYFMIVAVHAIASIRHGNYRNLLLTPLQPFYYLLQVVTAYRAVWKLITAPYTWEKTEHK